jgi:hypothetical protein
MIVNNYGGPYRVDSAGRDGAIYVVAGSSGQISGGELNHPVMYLSLNELGSLVLDIDRGRIDAVFLRSDGSVGDAFTLVKPGVRQPLRITSFNVDSGLMNIEWTANAGETYHVERALSLSPPEWQRLGPPIIAIGDIALWTGPTGAEPYAFFRVVAF